MPFKPLPGYQNWAIGEIGNTGLKFNHIVPVLNHLGPLQLTELRDGLTPDHLHRALAIAQGDTSIGGGHNADLQHALGTLYGRFDAIDGNGDGVFDHRDISRLVSDYGTMINAAKRLDLLPADFDATRAGKEFIEQHLGIEPPPPPPKPPGLDRLSPYYLKPRNYRHRKELEMLESFRNFG